MSIKHFRRHVKWCPHDQIEATVPFEFLREAKISNFDIEVLFVGRVQQNILRLDISVNNLLKMHVIKSQHELVDYVRCLSLCESIRLSESVEKLSTLSQLRNHINVDIILNQIDYSDKIRMRLLSENLKLVLEELDKDV